MELTQEIVKEYFDYHQDGYLVWKKLHPRAYSTKIGDKAGSSMHYGHKRLEFFSKNYWLHKLIYLYHFNQNPKFIDHIDNNPLNNKIENLRPCDLAQNAWNRKMPSTNTTGFKGVTKKKNRFCARINCRNKRIHLGYFDTPEEAHEAYKKAALELHGEFARFE